MDDLSMLLKAPVVNPNDFDKYVNTGVQFFKITDRIMPDELLTEVCNAYFQRKYHGNYFDLFSYTSHLNRPEVKCLNLTEEEIKSMLREGYESILAHRRHFVLNPYVDADRLSKSGFMKIFEQGDCEYDCYHPDYSPRGCRHCKEFTEKLINYSEEEVKAIKNNIRMLIEASRKTSQNV